MKVQIFSIHPLIDNRINKHINTLLKNDYEVEYVNVSDMNKCNFIHLSNVKLTLYKKWFNNRSIINMISIYTFMLKELFRSDSNIVHIHDTYLLPLLLVAKIMGKKTVYDKHEIIEKSKGIYSILFTLFEKIFGRFIDAIVYVTQQQEPFIDRANYKYSVHIPNYQSIKDYNIKEFTPTYGEYTTLVYIGSLSEKDRRTLLMLDVFEKCMKGSKNIKCVLGGKIAQIEIEERKEFLEKNYPTQFKYLGYISYEKVIEETKKADVGLLFFKDDPITHYSSCNKLYEYLMCGLVFVGVGKFILEEEIKRLGAGRIFDFETSSDEISNYVLDLIINKEELLKIRCVSYELGMNYSWESIENRYLELYDVLMGADK